MRRRTLPTLTPLLALTAGALPLFAYPISPVTLWELVDRADLVVVAEVQQVRDLERSDEELFGADSVAVLEIRETWKGSASSAGLEVEFVASLMCPAPSRYVEGERVLAFLERKGKGSFRTVGLSYGTLYPTSNELTDFREMVRRAMELREGLIWKRRPSGAEEIEWLVDAASRPGTRWHGLYELQPFGDSLHSYYDRNRRRLSKESPITNEHLHRVADGFVSSPPVDRTLPMALQFLATLARDDVDRAATAALETLVAREHPPYWIVEALKEYVERLGGDRAISERLDLLAESYSAPEHDELQSLWRDVHEQLDVPEVEPAPEREWTVGGVGADTPS